VAEHCNTYSSMHSAIPHQSSWSHLWQYCAYGRCCSQPKMLCNNPLQQAATTKRTASSNHNRHNVCYHP
jgi:hypothetical protein